MLPYNLDHVAVAVAELDEAIPRFEALYGAVAGDRERVETQGVEEVMIPVGGSHIQLIAPLDEDTPVGRFLDKRGEGLHHVALAVPNIEAALVHVRAVGGRLVDEEPRIGGRGALIAFVHPKSWGGTLVELVELPL
ncbi:MAG: methylmalonyl-CoA epimerase [Acidimicrobiia bacterium]|nr:methylmalonyl-CoA epimerase [Acidimicrobiia bacterium]